MMEPIKFFAAGLPKGQPRPKAFARGGIASVYDPSTAEGWKSQIAISGRSHVPYEVLGVALYLNLEFYMPRPAGHYVGCKKDRPIRKDAPVYHIGKPDSDNLAKAVMDALTVIRFWHDDSQVADLRVRKLYDNAAGPGCLITIKEAYL